MIDLWNEFHFTGISEEKLSLCDLACLAWCFGVTDFTGKKEGSCYFEELSYVNMNERMMSKWYTLNFNNNNNNNNDNNNNNNNNNKLFVIAFSLFIVMFSDRSTERLCVFLKVSRMVFLLTVRVTKVSRVRLSGCSAGDRSCGPQQMGNEPLTFCPAPPPQPNQRSEIAVCCQREFVYFWGGFNDCWGLPSWSVSKRAIKVVWYRLSLNYRLTECCTKLLPPISYLCLSAVSVSGLQFNVTDKYKI